MCMVLSQKMEFKFETLILTHIWLLTLLALDPHQHLVYFHGTNNYYYSPTDTP